MIRDIKIEKVNVQKNKRGEGFIAFINNKVSFFDNKADLSGIKIGDKVEVVIIKELPKVNIITPIRREVRCFTIKTNEVIRSFKKIEISSYIVSGDKLLGDIFETFDLSEDTINGLNMDEESKQSIFRKMNKIKLEEEAEDEEYDRLNKEIDKYTEPVEIIRVETKRTKKEVDIATDEDGIVVAGVYKEIESPVIPEGAITFREGIEKYSGRDYNDIISECEDIEGETLTFLKAKLEFYKNYNLAKFVYIADGEEKSISMYIKRS